MGRVAALALAPGTHAALPVATARARLAPTTRVVVAPGRLVRFGLVRPSGPTALAKLASVCWFSFCPFLFDAKLGEELIA